MDRCPTLRELEQHVRDDLAADAAGRLEAHLGACAECRRAVEQMRDAQVQTRPVRITARPETPQPTARRSVALRQTWAGPIELPEPVEEPHSTHQTRADPERGSIDTASCLDDLKQLGPYRLIRLIGRGGMGVVYWAEDTHLQRDVAIKVLRPSAAHDPEQRQRFLCEARAMAALKHDHIAVIYQVGEAATEEGPEGLPFLAMELLEGENLDTWMKANPHPPAAWVARIGREAAEGLAAAHARGLLHRDIKPANLWLEAPTSWLQAAPASRPLLGAVGRIKLLDFGLALPTLAPGPDEEPIVGTPAYMAPEQARGEALDVRCDLFGLGCVLYQMSTGRHPFPRRQRGDPTSWPPHTPPVPVRELNPAIPPRLADLIERLVAESPADRPGSARQVARELAAIEQAARGPLPAAHTDTEAWPPLPRTNLPRRAALALVLLGLACMASGAGWAAWSRSRGTIAETSALPTPTPSVVIAPPTRADALAGPPDAAWCRKVRELPAHVQLNVVLAKLKELNPEFDGEPERARVANGQVVELRFATDAVTDVRPVQALANLKALGCMGSAPGRGRLTDLGPLTNLQLDWLFLWHNPDLTDFRPLKAMRLVQFEASWTGFAQLADLSAERLQLLNIQHTAVTDLGELPDYPHLGALYCNGCTLRSIAPLRHTRIKELNLDYQPARDLEVLRGLKGLQKINQMPTEEFWHRHPATAPDVPEPS